MHVFAKGIRADRTPALARAQLVVDLPGHHVVIRRELQCHAGRDTFAVRAVDGRSRAVMAAVSMARAAAGLVDLAHLRMRTCQPGWWRGGRSAWDDAEAFVLQQAHGPVHPGEVKHAVARLHLHPREFQDAHAGDAVFSHQVQIAFPSCFVSGFGIPGGGDRNHGRGPPCTRARRIGADPGARRSAGL